MTLADFWWLLTISCLVWYCTITVYVSIRGVWDIKHMLARLKSNSDARERQSDAQNTDDG